MKKKVKKSNKRSIIFSFIVVFLLIQIFPMIRDSFNGNGIIADHSDSIHQSSWTPWIPINYAYEGYAIWEIDYFSHCDDITVDDAGNIYLSGRARNASTGEKHIKVVKFDTEMNQVWNVTVGSNHYNGLFIDSKGNITVIADTWLIKLNNSDGSVLWCKNLSLTLTNIALDGSDNIYLTTRNDTGLDGSRDFMVLKYNPEGAHVWNASWGTNGNDDCNQVIVDGSGNVYVAATVWGIGAGEGDACLIKFNNTGKCQWYSTFGGPDWDHGNSVALDSEDNPYLAGNFYGDMFVAKYYKNGTKIWHGFYGFTYESAYCVDLFFNKTNDHLYLCGFRYYGADDWSFCFFHGRRTYSSWQTLYFEWESSLQEIATTATIDSQGNVYIAGDLRGQGYGQYYYDKMGFARFGKDYDNDDLSNNQERDIYGTDGSDPDTDDDGYTDGWEVRNGYDPLNPNSFPGSTSIPFGSFYIIFLALSVLALVIVIVHRVKFK